MSFEASILKGIKPHFLQAQFQLSSGKSAYNLCFRLTILLLRLLYC
jgi:hypothetical protein